MRLIRRVIQPAYITSFNQSLELKTSNQTLNNVFCRMDNGSNLQCVVRGKSSKAASVPSGATSERRKIGKRMPRNERKLMVESYVNKYREMNAGKFPTATDTYKSVGGSYYIAKDILEELKYSSKLSCSDKMDTTALPNNAESMSISQPTHDEGPSQLNSGILMRDELKGDNSLSKSERTLSTEEIVDGPLSKDAQNESTLITQPSYDEGLSSFQQNSQVLSIDAETPSSQQPVARQQQSVDSVDTSERYREMNAGKFPTATDTNKSVGGSCYVVKDILEELKYSSKLSCSDKMDTTALPNNAESMSMSQPTHDEGPSNVQQNSGILMRDELKGDKSLSKSERTLSTEEIVDGPLSKDAQNESTLITQPSNDEGPSSFQQNTEVLSIHAETQSSQPPVAARQQQSVDSDETSERDLDKVPAENAPEKKSSLWQNLKSLTSGFFDKWRR